MLLRLLLLALLEDLKDHRFSLYTENMINLYNVLKDSKQWLINLASDRLYQISVYFGPIVTQRFYMV